MVDIRNGTRPMKVSGGRLNFLQLLCWWARSLAVARPSAASQAEGVRGGNGSWVELVNAVCLLPRLE